MASIEMLEGLIFHTQRTNGFMFHSISQKMNLKTSILSPRALYSFRQWIQTFPRDDGMTPSPRTQSGRGTRYWTLARHRESRPKAQRHFTDSFTRRNTEKTDTFAFCRWYETTFNSPALAITLTCGFRGLYGDALCLILKCLFSLRLLGFYVSWLVQSEKTCRRK